VDTSDVITTAIAIASVAISLYSTLTSARKSEVETLRGIIDELEKEVNRWKERYHRVCEWIESLGYDPADADLWGLDEDE
jgi:hypothetical protein